jgi:hypothetical protein
MSYVAYETMTKGEELLISTHELATQAPGAQITAEEGMDEA